MILLTKSPGSPKEATKNFRAEILTIILLLHMYFGKNNVFVKSFRFLPSIKMEESITKKKQESPLKDGRYSGQYPRKESSHTSFDYEFKKDGKILVGLT